jgi:putative acetyltransferase
MLSVELRQSASRSVLCWLATASQDGRPNVSPKEIFAIVDDEYFVIANIASPASVRNLKDNANACVSFVDVFVQKGFKLMGTARNVGRSEHDYARWAAPLEAKAGPRFPIHSVIVMKVSEVVPIVAPSYRLYPDTTTESTQVEAALRTYGVQRASMVSRIVIRSETDADAGTITEVTVAAFRTLEISHHTEQFIVAALRAAHALSISLVATLDGRVIGHIAFSPVAISDGTPHWYGLGPVSVLPEYQRQGIGKALIEEGLSRLKGMNALGCCLVGHPGYYRKFGFVSTPELGVEGVPPEFFFALRFGGHVPQGTVTFHEGFEATGT